MPSRSADTRGAAVELSLGNLIAAASVAVLLIAAPRSLGATGFGDLGLAWTVTAVFGFGIAVPIEQVLTRRLLSRSGRTTGPMRWLIGACLVASAGMLTWWLVYRPSGAVSSLSWAGVLGFACWTLAVPLRARLAASGDLRGYALGLVFEGAIRTGLVLASLLLSPSKLLMGLAIGLPLLAPAALVWSRAATSVKGEHTATGALGSRMELASVVLVALGYQTCLNGAPIVLSVLGRANAETLGQFVLASSVARLPTILAAGLATQALVKVGACFAVGDLVKAGQQSARAVRAASLVAVASSLVLFPLIHPLLRVLLGRDVRLGSPVIASLCVSTAVGLVTAVVCAALIAMEGASAAAASWGLGAAALLGGLGVSGSALGWGGSLWISLGPILALGSSMWALRHLRARLEADAAAHR